MAKILYHAVPVPWRKEEKYAFLEKAGSVAGVKWQTLTPDAKGNWITNDTDEEYGAFLPIGSKEAKAGLHKLAVFRTYSPGINTARDAVAYDFTRTKLASRVETFCDEYNMELQRWLKRGKPADIDNFVSYERIKWSETLKRRLASAEEALFNDTRISQSLYRPFNRMHLYVGPHVVDRPGAFATYFSKVAHAKNRMICVSGEGSFKPFHCLASDLQVGFDCIEKTQCFPLFTYSKDGKERRDNITPKALTLFQIFYDDESITREDIFHYVYALLHHPTYRTRFAENLKRELPRIPFVGVEVTRLKSLASKAGKELEPPHVGSYSARFFPLSSVATMQGEAKPDHDPQASAKPFHAFAAAGKQLADLHVNYESAQKFPLQRQENKEVKLDWRVEAMKLSKDKASLIYNDFLTLSGIPPEAFDYRLGNRSALEWVIDQYRVSLDEQGNIASDPNRLDDEEYIVRLIGQVITVSLETQRIVTSLPPVVFE